MESLTDLEDKPVINPRPAPRQPAEAMNNAPAATVNAGATSQVRLGSPIEEEPAPSHIAQGQGTQAQRHPSFNEPAAASQLQQPAGRRTAKRGTPKHPRPIRMMVGRPGFDIVAEFRDLLVSNLKWGTLMDMAHALRRQIGAGLLLERRERKAKGKQRAEPDPREVNAMTTKPDWKHTCSNFFTTAVLKVDKKFFGINKVMIDPGSVVSMASIEVIEKIGAPVYAVQDLTIRTATSALTKIRYYSDVDTEVTRVKTRIRIFAMPREFVLSYGLLLSRPWLHKVKAQGNYEGDTYVIADDTGRFHKVKRYHEKSANAVEIPKVGIKRQSSESSGIDEETLGDLDIVEASGDSDEDVIRDVIGQATKAMREQSLQESDDDSYDEAGSSEDDWLQAGNESNF